MDATDTRYVETKHQWNLGIEDLSIKTHVVKSSILGS
jgi:hypothetical protein